MELVYRRWKCGDLGRRHKSHTKEAKSREGWKLNKVRNPESAYTLFNQALPKICTFIFVSHKHKDIQQLLELFVVIEIYFDCQKAESFSHTQKLAFISYSTVSARLAIKYLNMYISILCKVLRYIYLWVFFRPKINISCRFWPSFRGRKLFFACHIL